MQPVKITGAKNLNFENIAIESLIKKGIQIVGIVDCASPIVIKDIEEFLKNDQAIELEDGGIIYKNSICIFLGSEVETTEKRKDGKKGFAHSVCFFPKLEDIKGFSNEMKKYITNTNLSTQKAKISAYELLDIVEKYNGILIPAHIFTPFKSFYGNCTDSLKDIFKDKFDKIKGVELGLSSDTLLANTITELDDKIFLTNSDAHSLPKIAREYNEIELKELSFKSFKKLLGYYGKKEQQNNYIVANYGLDPRLGRYYRTFCDNCNSITTIENGLCTKCGSKKVVKGVYDRILEIQDRDIEKKTNKEKDTNKIIKEKEEKYKYQIPLQYIPGIGTKTREKLFELFGNEMNILHKVPIDNIEGEFGDKIAKRIQNVRDGKVNILSGGGGIYGKVKKDEIKKTK